jgi:phosphoenolpyruvate carboxykinase (ATP)
LTYETANKHSWKKHAAEALAWTGVQVACAVHSNQTAPALVAAALRRGEGRLSSDGAFMVETGAHTGRSVQDKFVVDEPSVTADIWWGKVNQRMAVDKFNTLKGRIQAYLQGQEGTVH